MEISDERIAEFCLITEADANTAKYYLDAASGDLDVAVGLFMESSASTITATPPTNTIREPIQPRMSTLTEDGGSSRFPDHETTHLLGRRPPIAASSRVTEQSIFGRQSGSLSPGERDDETSTRQRLAHLFRAPNEIMFADGGFEDAKRVARRPFEERPFRYLLVTIHVNTEFVCQVMNRDVWNDTLVQQVVRQNFIFLQLTDGTPEAVRFISYYNIDTARIPIVTIIDPRTGEKVREWTDKKWTSGPMIEALIEFLSSHESSGEGARESQQAPDASPVDKTDDMPANEKVQPRAFLDPEPESSNPRATLIQFRLPDGSKLRRRFLIDAPIASLFAFLDSSQSALPCGYKLRSTLSTFAADDQRTLLGGDIKNVTLTVVDGSIDS